MKLRHAIEDGGVTRHLRAVGLVVLLLAAGCASDGGGSGATSTSTPPKRAVRQLAAKRFPIGGAPWGVAADGDTVWVSDAAQGALLQIGSSGEVVRQLATAAPDPRDAGVAVGDGQLWVANLGGTVGVVDISSGRPVARVSAGEGEPAAVALDDRWAWVPTHGPGGGLVRLDRRDPRLEPLAIPLPESGFAVAVAGDTVWVAGLEGRVFAVDRDTGAVERTIEVGGAPRGVAVADGDVWVSLRDDRAVVRIDAVTGEEIARIDTGGEPWPIAARQNTVWVATLNGRLLGIDASSNAITAESTVATDARGVAVTESAVWVTSQTGVVALVEDRRSSVEQSQEPGK